MPARKPSPKQPFGLDDLRRLLDACYRTRFPQRNRALLLTLIGTGCRRSEVIGMRLGDIDWEAGNVVVNQPKGRRKRHVAPGGAAMDALAAYVALWQPADALWLNRFGRPLTIDGLDQLVRWLGRYAGVPNVFCHRFRTTFACLLLDMTGGDLEAVQVGMGHSKPSQTLEYSRWGSERRSLDVMRKWSLADRIA